MVLQADWERTCGAKIWDSAQYLLNYAHQSQRSSRGAEIYEVQWLSPVWGWSQERTLRYINPQSTRYFEKINSVSTNEHREFWLYGVSFNSEFFHLTFTSNILQLNCYDIFIFYTVYRNVIIDIRITIILSTYMNQSNLMIIQNFIILSFIISYLVCDQEWILYIIIFRSPILWNQMNSIP